MHFTLHGYEHWESDRKVFPVIKPLWRHHWLCQHNKTQWHTGKSRAVLNDMLHTKESPRAVLVQCSVWANTGRSHQSCVTQAEQINMAMLFMVFELALWTVPLCPALFRFV